MPEARLDELCAELVALDAQRMRIKDEIAVLLEALGHRIYNAPCGQIRMQPYVTVRPGKAENE